MLSQHNTAEKPVTHNQFSLFSAPAKKVEVPNENEFGKLLVSDPDKFIQKLMQQPNYLSVEMAQEHDSIDPQGYTGNAFDIGETIPFAGHSLGPLFKPTADKIHATLALQKQLHAGHFKESHPDGDEGAAWFDCDRHIPGLIAARQLLGFEKPEEFNFTSNGLSDNLAKLMDTFYSPGAEDWQGGKTKIVILANEFFSDQAVVTSVVKRAIKGAARFHCFTHKAEPKPEEEIIRIAPDKDGIYSAGNIIATIKLHASKIQMIILPDIVFNTGQRLSLHAIFSALKKEIEDNKIFIGLDLAHTVGNRAVNLEGFPVRISFAVGCAYKHLSGPAGSGFGIYVNRHLNLDEYPPLQGWKSADSSRVFPVINQYDDNIMATTGALAFRISNPPPIPLHPVQTFLSYFGKIGFDKCFNKSECLTRYLILQLQQQLGDKIEFVTSQNPHERGAMLVFRIKEAVDLNKIEHQLKAIQPDLGLFEIDTRPPNNIRLTAHYGYTKFEHICRLVTKLELVINNKLEHANVVALAANPLPLQADVADDESPSVTFHL
jgi:kynureninase